MDTGSIAWGLTATALVLFMTPGVALFYGGLVKAKSVVSMMMMSFGALGLITVLWAPSPVRPGAGGHDGHGATDRPPAR